MRFFGNWTKAAGMPAAVPDRSSVIARAAYPDREPRDRSDEPIFGLFPEPER
jgi:hypothetical protein